MKKTIQTFSLNSKVGRTYTLDPINRKEKNPPGNHILDMAELKTIPIPTEQHSKTWLPFRTNP